MNYKTLFLLITPFVAVGCAAGPANADDTRNVETNVSISASPERVLRAFVDHEDLHGWWNVSRSFVEDRPGGVWSVTWDDYGEDKTQHAWIGVVEEISPPWRPTPRRSSL